LVTPTDAQSIHASPIPERVSNPLLERVAKNGGLFGLFGGWGCFGAIVGPALHIWVCVVEYRNGVFPWWGAFVVAASIPVFWVLLPICLWLLRTLHDWTKPDVIITTKEKLAGEILWWRYGGSILGIGVALFISSLPSIWLVYRGRTQIQQVTEQAVNSGEVNRLAQLPQLAARSAANPDASSWLVFLEWYNAARECGGINFPTAEASGEAMYAIVDTRAERGKVVAEARRRVAMEEWNTATELRRHFPSASDDEYRAALAIVFCQSGAFRNANGKWGWQRSTHYLSGGTGYFVNALSAEWFLAPPPERNRDGNLRMTHLIQCGVAPAPRSGGNCQATALIRTDAGVRIDPFGVRVGYEEIRNPASGELSSGIVEEQPSSVERALRGAQPWITYLRTVLALADSPRANGDISEFIFIVQDELHGPSSSSGPEAGWTFDLSTLVDRRSPPARAR
jgi:hypothetical protein